MDFVKVATLAEVPPGELKLVELEGEPVAVANVGGQIFAIGAECTHAGGPLDEGYLEDDILTCPWHGGQFNVRTGEVESPPPQVPVVTFQVKTEGEDILLGRP